MTLAINDQTTLNAKHFNFRKEAGARLSKYKIVPTEAWFAIGDDHRLCLGPYVGAAVIAGDVYFIAQPVLAGTQQVRSSTSISLSTECGW